MIGKHRLPRDSQSGFTIIELMIATAILSTILVIVTVVMISIGSLYYKGINEAQVQDNTRNISIELSEHLQLSDGFTTDLGVNPAIPRAYCIGTTRYTYIDGIQLGKSATYKHVLWRDTVVAGGACPAAGPGAADLTNAQPSPGGTELMPPLSRLTAFTVTGASPYTVSVGIAYGDDDLLCDNGTPGDCAPTAPVSINLWNPNPPHGTVLCKGQKGDQYCATATLTTTVVRRLTSS
jgi:prepilin-type N-terminal cleavage/methylation domain-containing protein